MPISLKNGSLYEQHEVDSILSSLETLKREHALVFIALVHYVRSPGHYLSRNASRELRSAALMTSTHQVRQIIRDVVLSAVSRRSEYDFELVSPYASVPPYPSETDTEPEAAAALEE